MDDDRGDFYYVFDMPLDEERKPPRKVRKITLDTREEVEAFFHLLNNLHGDKNDWNLFWYSRWSKRKRRIYCKFSASQEESRCYRKNGARLCKYSPKWLRKRICGFLFQFEIGADKKWK